MPSKISTLQYTSGTTGQPKGAQRTIEDLSLYLAASMTFLAEFGYQEDDVHLACCPLYHSAPPVFAAFSSTVGGTVVVMPRFEPAEFLRLVEKEKVTSSFVVPTVLQAVLNLPEEEKRRYDLSSLRSVIVAGAQCPERVKLEIVDLFGPCLYEFYGSTEGMINTIMKPADFARKPKSCGRAGPFNEIRILDPTGRECPTGGSGEICVKNPLLMMSYYKDDQKTEDSFREGFYRTGDVGYVDEEGFYYIVDREKDMIISGGVNIYPAEIENELISHPKVYDAAVIGVPDEYWGEAVKAFIVLKPGQTATAEEIAAYCLENMADYKKPRHVVFMDELPRSPEGKMLKNVLRRMG
ncbi:MAG: AMP-binding protein [Proteobacteria bacterium]|nr:AMP-binding protein [Pseudomonadota bacterium]